MIDGTASLLRGSDLPADCTSYALSVDGILKAKPTWSSERFTPSFPRVPGATMHSKIHHRIHFRLVFKEVCTPIYELQHLGTVFKTLQDVYKALQFLHSAGWVHRDVSTGNALRAGKVGKLADLEYAKRMDSEATHDVPTGTLDFMACEVEAQTYLFELHDKEDQDDEEDEDAEDAEEDEEDEDSEEDEDDEDSKEGEDDEDDKDGEEDENDQHVLPFKFNPLHDMESLWWISIWILYHHVDKAGKQLSEAQKQWFDELFPGRLNARFCAFSGRVNSEVLPTSFRPAARIVTLTMRQELRVAYVASEKSIPPAYIDALATLQLVFTRSLARAAACSKHVKLYTPSAKRSYQEDPTVETRDSKHPKLE
ncbi:hypothetical protein M404DRAFT_33665 [Pisolithus tinctorius Marx 270]|uniref:Fungal-type protein kinase domain-containing protein n=1 Tax=Pisolithus tinctorius Marx 270 TaxID=870435 RepID=A0A0C3JEF6_PISTI|nr:hypothetical protein M404DRAFT_33665 [Pisolithus tinctorius Marx 270]